MKQNIQKKNILFIGTNFYDYEKDIIKLFEVKGARVFYFSSIINTLITRLLKLLCLNELLFQYLKLKISKKIDKMPSDIHYIFVIKGENLQKCHFNQLRNKYPDIPRILYLWDSICLLKNVDLLFSQFDKVITFDRKDAESNNLIFRPLFYRNESSGKNLNIEYGISFVGNAHSIRYKTLKQLKSLLDKNRVPYKFVLVISKLDYFKKLLNGEIDYKDRKMFLINKIDYDEYMTIGMKSNVIFDIPFPSQSGLTIRSIEALGLRKKILTTNKDICNYGFPDSIYNVFDPENPVIDLNFIMEDLVDYFDISSYSIKSFVEDIISEFPMKSCDH